MTPPPARMIIISPGMTIWQKGECLERIPSEVYDQKLEHLEPLNLQNVNIYSCLSYDIDLVLGIRCRKISVKVISPW